MSSPPFYPSTRQDLVNTGLFFIFTRQKGVRKPSSTRQRRSVILPYQAGKKGVFQQTPVSCNFPALHGSVLGGTNQIYDFSNHHRGSGRGRLGVFLLQVHRLRERRLSVDEQPICKHPLRHDPWCLDR